MVAAALVFVQMLAMIKIGYYDAPFTLEEKFSFPRLALRLSSGAAFRDFLSHLKTQLLDPLAADAIEVISFPYSLHLFE